MRCQSLVHQSTTVAVKSSEVSSQITDFRWERTCPAHCKIRNCISHDNRELSPMSWVHSHVHLVQIVFPFRCVLVVQMICAIKYVCTILYIWYIIKRTRRSYWTGLFLHLTSCSEFRTRPSCLKVSPTWILLTIPSDDQVLLISIILQFHVVNQCDILHLVPSAQRWFLYVTNGTYVFINFNHIAKLCSCVPNATCYSESPITSFIHLTNFYNIFQFYLHGQFYSCLKLRKWFCVINGLIHAINFTWAMSFIVLI